MTDEEEKSKTLSPKDIEILTSDYEQASQEARYRDETLYNFYYFVLLILGGLIPVGVTLFIRRQYALLTGAALVGSYAFSLIVAWAYGAKRSRNAAWHRREQIEEMLADHDVRRFRTNQSIIDADKNFGYFEYDDRDEGGDNRLNKWRSSLNWLLFGYRKNGPTNLISSVLVPAAALSWIVAVVSARLWLSSLWFLIFAGGALASIVWVLVSSLPDPAGDM